MKMDSSSKKLINEYGNEGQPETTKKPSIKPDNEMDMETLTEH